MSRLVQEDHNATPGFRSAHQVVQMWAHIIVELSLPVRELVGGGERVDS